VTWAWADGDKHVTLLLFQTFAQRSFGRREMQSLMAALHLIRPIDTVVARNLVIAAADVFLCLFG